MASEPAIEAVRLRKRYGAVEALRGSRGVFAFIGLTASSPEAANAYGFTILFPVTFISSAFVTTESMRGWLEPFAEHNPFTTMVDATRALFLGTAAGNDVWLAVVWSLAIVAVFGPLSAWRYRRSVTR